MCILETSFHIINLSYDILLYFISVKSGTSGRTEKLSRGYEILCHGNELSFLKFSGHSDVPGTYNSWDFGRGDVTKDSWGDVHGMYEMKQLSSP